MIGKLTPDDPKPNSNQEFCENCECIVDETDIKVDNDRNYGCINCIYQCGWCGETFIQENLTSYPYYKGGICRECIRSEDFKRDLRVNILKDALRCLFNNTRHKQIEKETVNVAKDMNFIDLAIELKNDI